MQRLARAFGDVGGRPDGKDARRQAPGARRSLSERRQRPRLSGQHHRRRHRHQPDRGDAGRLQRSRLGARQPLAGRGSRLSHRPDAHGQRHLHGGRRHDRRLRPERAREEGRARQRGRRRQVARAGSRQAMCWTSCSVRCARCRRGWLHRLAHQDVADEDLVDRLLRQARLEIEANRAPAQHARRRRPARPKKPRRSGARSRRSPGRSLVHRSNATDSRARPSPASSTS